MKPSHLKKIDQYFEGSLTQEQCKEFSTLLSQSYELRKEFRKRAVLDEYLHSESQHFEPSSLPQKRRSKFIKTAIGLLAACIVVGLMMINLRPAAVDKDQGLGVKTNDDLSDSKPIAQLIDYYDINISNHSAELREINFARGDYEIASGSIHLRFQNCVDFLFSGPGSFEIIGPKLVKVSRGKLRVIVLNSKGQEFTVQTPSNQYIDWGTEFCLNIPANGIDVINVHEGEVEVKSMLHNDLPEMLSRFSQKYPIPVNQSVSVDKKLNNITPGSMGRFRNIQQINEFSNNPDVIGIYDLEYHSTDFEKTRIPKTWTAHAENMAPHRFIKNLHKSSKEASHGIFHGSNRTSGRWYNSLALNLFQDDAHLSIDLEKNYQSFSLSFWFMQNGRLKKPLNSLVRPYRWEEFGNLSIEISRSGKISQFLWGETDLSPIKSSNSKIKEGWNHLVYTFGKKGKQLSSKVYLNADLVNEAIPKWTQFISLRNMIIGSSKNPQGQYLNGFRSVLDELIVWKKTLSENEIQEQYLNGLPLYDLSDQEIQILANKNG